MAKKIECRVWVILALIVGLAAILRFWRLSEYPAGLHIDEASLGYNAYSLLKTGRDENGKFLPLHIDMFGDNRPAGYQYLDILPIKFFGLNEFATRFPSALFGALTSLVIFLLAREIFKNTSVGLLTAILLAISPWHVVIPRASAETIVALFLIIFGIYLWLNGDRRSITLGGLLMALSFFFYHTPRVFVPVLLAVLIFLFYLLEKKKNLQQILLVFGLLTFLSLFLIFGTKEGTGRFQQVSIFHFPEIRLVLEEQIGEDGVVGLPVLATRFFHNKLINYGFGYLKEYFRYFSFNFLFIEGGLPIWYQIPNMGLMYLAELPFFLIGLFSLANQAKKKRLLLIPLIWLVLGPTVASLTRDDTPNIQRSLVMLPALVMITAFGFYQGYIFAKKYLKKVIFHLGMGVLILGFIWNFSYFLHQYFVHAKIHRPWYRFEGFKEMVLKVNELAPKYEKVFISKAEGGVYMHFLFFSKIEPAEYQKLGSPKDKDYGGFGKYIFFPQQCVFGKNALLVASGKCQEAPFTSSEAIPIYRGDGTVVFRIYPGGKNEKEKI